MPLYKNSMKKNIKETKGQIYRLQKIFNNIFEGVSYLHKQGIFHRDLKPENILMNTDDDLVIGDFSIVTEIDAITTRITYTGEGLGTAFYASPEQMNNLKNVDQRSDIYSLGKMILECFTESPNINSYDPNYLPIPIDYVFERSTKHSKEERYNNIDEMRNSFDSAIETMLDTQDKNSINNILNKFNIQFDEVVSKKDVDSLIKFLIEAINNPDSIREILMQIPPYIFKIMVENHKENTKKIIKIFKDHVLGQGWPWGYTDDIADKCKDFFNVIEDNEIKAFLIYIIIKIGISHNRFHVINIAKDILRNIKDPAESFVITENLKPLKQEIKSLDLRETELSSPLDQLLD